jgi:hypothetical protein
MAPISKIQNFEIGKNTSQGIAKESPNGTVLLGLPYLNCCLA